MPGRLTRWTFRVASTGTTYDTPLSPSLSLSRPNENRPNNPADRALALCPSLGNFRFRFLVAIITVENCRLAESFANREGEKVRGNRP